MKKKLIQLLKRARNVSNIREKILSNIDRLSADRIKAMIDILLKAEIRQERINKGEGLAVIEEIQCDRVKPKQATVKSKMDKIHKVENQVHAIDEILANSLIADLNSIH